MRQQGLQDFFAIEGAKAQVRVNELQQFAVFAGQGFEGEIMGIEQALQLLFGHGFDLLLERVAQFLADAFQSLVVVKRFTRSDRLQFLRPYHRAGEKCPIWHHRFHFIADKHAIQIGAVQLARVYPDRIRNHIRHRKCVAAVVVQNKIVLQRLHFFRAKQRAPQLQYLVATQGLHIGQAAYAVAVLVNPQAFALVFKVNRHFQTRAVLKQILAQAGMQFGIGFGGDVVFVSQIHAGACFRPLCTRQFTNGIRAIAMTMPFQHHACFGRMGDQAYRCGHHKTRQQAYAKAANKALLALGAKIFCAFGRAGNGGQKELHLFGG